MERTPFVTNVLTDVGGVTFTFDQGKRKKIWIQESGDLVQKVLAGTMVKDKYPELLENPYNVEYRNGNSVLFEEQFKRYATGIAERLGMATTDEAFKDEAGKQVLQDMLIDPTATRVLEYIQGEMLESGKLAVEEVPGIRNLIRNVMKTGGVVRGYSTGTPKMPDQFHLELGLFVLVRNVLTTFPEYKGKEKNVEQVERELRRYFHVGLGYHIYIDDNDNEIGIVADAVESARGSVQIPGLYLLKKDLPEEATGVASTSKGDVYVVNSLDQITRTISHRDGSIHRRKSTYVVEFDKSDNKFAAK